MTPEERAAVTEEQFLGFIRDVVSQRPDTRNPVDTDLDLDEPGCVYTDADGNHCLIGQVLEEIDPGNLPPLESTDPYWDRNVSQGAADLLDNLGYSRPVTELASIVQSYADGVGSKDGDGPPTWAEALNRVEQHLEAR